MNVFSADKYEKKLWTLTIKVVGVSVLFGIILYIIVPQNILNATKYPSWWAELANWLKIIWFLALIAFGATVVIKGRKIMKDKDENE